MKKKLLLFVAILLATLSVAAQSQLTIGDGTKTSSYVPIYGLYINYAGTRTQFVLSSDALSDMNGQPIHSMTFYSSTDAYDYAGGVFSVKLKEVTEEDVSTAYLDTTGATTVYLGALSVVDGKLEIEFNAPFNYQGGNLLVECATVTKCTSSKSLYFYGEESGAGSFRYGRTGQAGTVATATTGRVPKTTFEYGTITCAKPAGRPEATSVETYSASFKWKPATGATGYEYVVVAKDGTPDWTNAQSTTDTVATVNNLTQLTKYDFCVRSACAEGEKSLARKCSFRTACPANWSIPYSENFDSYTPSTSVPYTEPDCWNAWYNKTSGTATSTYARIYSSSGFEGYCYYMGSKLGTKGDYSTTVDAYAVLPTLDADLSHVMISFKAKASTATGTRKLLIGVCDYDEPYDSIVKYTVVDTVIISGNTYADYGPIRLSKYQGTGKHIVLQLTGGLNDGTTTVGYAYLDNLLVEEIPSCVTPTNLKAQAKSGTEIRLTWTSTESQWDVAYVAAGGSMEDASIVSADTTDVVISGLEPSTAYDFYVRANCGASTSDWTEAQVASTYYKVELDEAQWNFDDNRETMVKVNHSTVETMVNYPSWYADNAVYKTAATYVPYVYPTTTTTIGETSAMYGYSSDYSLRVYSTSANQPAWAALPEINADLDNLQLRFAATSAYMSNRSTQALYTTYAKGTYPHSIKVGVMTDPADISTFHQLAEYVLPEVTATKVEDLPTGDYWTEYTLPLYGAKQYGQYIAFMSDYSANNTVYLDNVIVETESGCSAPNALAAEVGARTATLSWNSNKSSWNVLLKQDSVVLVDSVVSTTTFQATGLKGATAYTLAVRAICAKNDSSEWAELEFETLCDKYDSTEAKWNFKENLSTYIPGQSSYLLPQCWTGGQLERASASTYSYMPQAKANTSAAQYGREPYDTTKNAVQDRALQFYSSTSYYNSYAILPELNVDNDGTELHFWFRAAYFYPATYSTAASQNKLAAANSGYPKDLIVGLITDVNDMSTFKAVDTLTYDRLNASSATGIFATDDLYGQEYWQEASLALENYKNGRVVLYYPGAATGYLFVDDITIKAKATCEKPEVTVSAIGSDSAVISWTGTASGYTIQLIQAGDTTLLSATENPYVLRNLQPDADYMVGVRMLCSATDSSEVGYNTFTTYCAAVTPETLGLIDFEDATYTTGSTTNGLAANCWTVGNQGSTNTTYIPYVVASNGHEGAKSLYLNAIKSSTTIADGAYAILPPMDFSAAGGLQKYMMTLWFRKASTTKTAKYDRGDTLLVAVVPDLNDLETYTVVDTLVESTATYKKDTVDFSRYPELTKGNIMFLAKVNNSDSTYRYASFYVDEISLQVPRSCVTPVVTLAKDSDRQAEISWTGSAQKYFIALSETAVDAENNTEWLQTDTVADATSYVITGLKPGSSYYVYVKGICDDDESYFSDGLAFTTDCGVITVDEFGVESFEDAAAFNCWIAGNKQSTTTTYIPKVSSSATAAYEGTHYLYLNAASTSSVKADSAYAILPEIDFSAKGGLQHYNMTFHFRNSGSSDSYKGYLCVAVIPDMNQPDSFVVVKTLQNNTTKYVADTVDFSSYTGEGGRVVLIAKTNTIVASNYARFYVDNIEFAAKKYQILFKNYNGDTLQLDSLTYGEMPVYSGATPEKSATEQYTYTFKGWDPELTEVVADAVYTAKFEEEEVIPTGLDDAAAEQKAVKFVKDGKLYIRKGGVLYDAAGRKAE